VDAKTLFVNLRTHLRGTAWTGTANEVFGDEVYIVPRVPMENLSRFGMPCCFILDKGSDFYDQHPGLEEQKFQLVVFQENVADPYGEGVVLSANRTANTSKGAGILEIEQEIVRSLKSVTALSSAKITLRHRNKIEVAMVKENEPSVFRSLTFSAFTSIESTPDPLEILRVPGILWWAPTNLGTPAYGTRLGFLSDGVLWEPGYKTLILAGEEKGEEPTQKYFLGTAGKVYVRLLNYNSSAIARLFPGCTSSTKVQYPNSFLAGTDLTSSTYTDRLLYVPDDTTNNPCLLLQKSAPNVEDTIRLSRGDDTEFLCVFDAFRKTNDVDGISYLGLIAGATLR